MLNLSEAFRSCDKFQCEPLNSEVKVKPKLTPFHQKLKRELGHKGYGFTQKAFTFTEGGGLGSDPAEYKASEVKTCLI